MTNKEPARDTSIHSSSDSGTGVSDKWPVPCLPEAANVYDYFIHAFKAKKLLCAADQRLCASLACSKDTLQSLKAGFYDESPKGIFDHDRLPNADAAGGDYCVLPYRNGSDNIIGCHLESLAGRDNFLLGQTGLISPTDWRKFPGMIVITRSVRDLLAYLTVGICAVYLPDSEDSVTLLIDAIKNYVNRYRVPTECAERTADSVRSDDDKCPDERFLIVVGDQEWASRVARKLRRTNLAVFWRLPLDGHADFHAQLKVILSNFAQARIDYRDEFWPEDEEISDNQVLMSIGDHLAATLEDNANRPDDELPETVPSAPSPTQPSPATSPGARNPSRNVGFSHVSKAPARDNSAWTEAECQILERLDIVAEYKAMGARIAADRPSDKGWLEVHAIDRADRNASAGIFVGAGSRRGHYKDLGSDCSLNFWNFAARFGKYVSWKAARQYFAEKTGVNLPGGKTHASTDRPCPVCNGTAGCRWKEDDLHLCVNRTDDDIVPGWMSHGAQNTTKKSGSGGENLIAR